MCRVAKFKQGAAARPDPAARQRRPAAGCRGHRDGNASHAWEICIRPSVTCQTAAASSQPMESRHFMIRCATMIVHTFASRFKLGIWWQLQGVTSTSNFIRNRQRLFNELNHILFQVTTGNHNAPGRRPGRRARLGSARTGLGLQVRADPTAVQCTCSGCDLSFNSKRAIDAHRTSKYVSPLCRKGFLGGQRLRLVVTARDFRVSGRHPRDRADDEGDYMMYT